MTEADLKRTVTDYLTIKQAQGELMFLRLNSGTFLVRELERTRAIKGCPKGTADFVVLREGFCGDLSDQTIVYFLELKSEKGKQSTEQRAFEIMAKSYGAEYHIIRSIEELQEILDEA